MHTSKTLALFGGIALMWGCSSGEDDAAQGSGGAASVVGPSGVGGTVAAGVGGNGTGGGIGAVGAGGLGAGGMGAGGSAFPGAGGTGAGGTAGVGGGFGVGGFSGGFGVGGTSGAGGGAAGGSTGAGGSGVGGSGSGGGSSAGTATGEAVDEGVVSFFVTSWFQLQMLADDEGKEQNSNGVSKGFGGDLRYPAGETDGLQGADNICQEMAERAGHTGVFWKAYLSTSKVDAIDHIEGGPWYDYNGDLIAADKAGLLSPSGNCNGDGDRLPGATCGTYDEVGTIHDGNGDTNDDGTSRDDDHDTMTATKEDGTYAGFSCSDWTSVTDVAEGGGRGGGIQMGHSWPAQSGKHWAVAHAGHSCAAGTNFIQDGPGDAATVGGGGGYGGFYCFASK